MSETQTASLTDFLLARIAEDNVVARTEAAQVAASARRGGRTAATRRVVQCEAQRRIVELHGPDDMLDHCATCLDGDFDTLGYPAREGWPCPTLRALASVYTDHPEFREEWRP